MYKYICECGYSGDYLVPHYRDNNVRCPVCSKIFEGILPIDLEYITLKCPYCKKENEDKNIEYYLTWITCQHCGRNFEAKKRVRYYIK